MHGCPTVQSSCSAAPTTYNGDGERQVLAQAFDDRRPLRDLARDQPRLVPEDEANDALSFRERRDGFRRYLAGSPSGVGRIGRSATYRAGEGIRTLPGQAEIINHLAHLQ